MKNIMVRDEVYEKLKAMKKEGESFSDVILRLVERKAGVEVLEKFAGSLAESEIDEIVLEERKKLRVRARFSTPP